MSALLVLLGQVVEDGGQLGLSLTRGGRVTVNHKLLRRSPGRSDLVSSTASGHLVCIWR